MYANASRHSRVAGTASEESKKGVVIPKREKGSIGKPPYVSKRISEEIQPEPFDVNEVNAISIQYGEKNISEEVDVIIESQKEQGQSESLSKQMEFTLAGFTPPKSQFDDKEAEKLERSYGNVLKLQDDSFLGEQNNVQLVELFFSLCKWE